MAFPGQAAFLQGIGWAILQSGWQIAALWLVYKIMSGLFLRHNVYAKYVLAFTTLFLGLMIFIFTAISFVFNSVSFVASSGYSFNTMLHKTEVLLNAPNLLNVLMPYLSLVYLLILGFRTVVFVYNFRHVKCLQAEQYAKVPWQLKLYTDQTAALLNIRRKVTVWFSEIADSPVTVGFIKPVILLPVAMVNHLNSEQMEAVILHELAHIKQQDYLLNTLLVITESVLYFHPLVHQIGKDIRKYREFCSDDLVLQFKISPASYGQALLIAEKCRVEARHNKLQLSALGTSNDLIKERLSRFSKIQPNKKSLFSGSWPIIASVFFLSMIFFHGGIPYQIVKQNEPLVDISPKNLIDEIESGGLGDVKTDGQSGNQIKGTVVISEKSELLRQNSPDVVTTKSANKPSNLNKPLSLNKPSSTNKPSNEYTRSSAVDSSYRTDNLSEYSQSMFHQVSDRTLVFELNGETYTVKQNPAAIAATAEAYSEKQAVTLFMSSDSTAMLLYPSVEKKGHFQTIELGNLNAIIQNLDWEKILHLQSKGADILALLKHFITLEIIARQTQLNKERADSSMQKNGDGNPVIKL